MNLYQKLKDYFDLTNQLPAFQINGEKSLEKLEELRMKSGCKDIREVLIRSLAIYECIVDEELKGGRVFVRTGDIEREIQVSPEDV